MNGSEYWVLLVGERGWTHRKFGDHLIEAWSPAPLLRDPHPSLTETT